MLQLEGHGGSGHPGQRRVRLTGGALQLDNLRAAVTRKNRAGTRVYLPEQALTVEQAVRLFTSDAAWASRDEAVRGTLELGKQADLVVLDRDLFAIEPDTFPEAKVLETVLNGRTVFRA